MGNVFSVTSSSANNVVNMDKDSEDKDNSLTNNGQSNLNDDVDSGDSETNAEERKTLREEAMSEFQRELSKKREQRKEILLKHRSEKEQLQQSLASESMAKLELLQKNNALRELLQNNNITIPEDLKSNSDDGDLLATVVEMRDEMEKIKKSNLKLRRDLTEANCSLQNAYSDIADLHGQNVESLKQISALKEVITISKSLIGLREQQLNELKSKLNEIEQSLADRETNMLSTDLRQEYERQLQNIRTLRGLYEERARLAEVTRQGLLREVEEQKAVNLVEINKCKELSEKVQELEISVNNLEDKLETKKDQTQSLQLENEGLKAQMLVVNKLFSQVLLGYKTEKDLDTLVHRLEEYHGLLTQMAENVEDSETSTALPKLLLELVSQIDEVNNAEPNITESNDTDSPLGAPQLTTAEKIVNKLPKVWKVLLELLSHQDIDNAVEEEKITTCYKTVETTSGPVLVPSVSKTYIRLKDLIIEKLSLIKEVNKMKQLNTHLESRLEEQEKRLCLVTTELSKTWHVVGRLRRHHHQLHTHEKILKYELQQKRKLLNELKEELEYCREKWDLAREKNSQSERDWKKLRAEFSNRKLKPLMSSLNNSAESGYSDERPSDTSSESNDESEYLNEPLVGRKVKTKSSLEVLDSSTDFQAEREDPFSDMIDVADLPLDSHEGDSHCDKGCVETEDEACEIVNETCVDETVDVSNNTNQQSFAIVDDIHVEEIPMLNPAAIRSSIKAQNERLELKDKKLEKLEKCSSSLLNQARNTSNLSNTINQALDIIIARPTTRDLNEATTSQDSSLTETSEQSEPINDDKICSELGCKQDDLIDKEIEDSQNNNSLAIGTNLENIINIVVSRKENISDVAIASEIAEIESATNANPVPKIDPAAILVSIKKQNERLAIRDQRFENMEKSCSKVVETLTRTIQSGDDISEKLDTLHNVYENKHGVDQVISAMTSSTTAESLNEQAGPSGLELIKLINNDSNDRESPKRKDRENSVDSEPSTSSDLDHEARFAARERRLKNLEEETKSLVKKVNKTTSKGVKINYKLDELHNIYGSENSRSGTPFDDKDCTDNDNSRDDSD